MKRAFILKILAVIFIVSIEMGAIGLNVALDSENLFLRLVTPTPTQVECVHVTVSFSAAFAHRDTHIGYDCPDESTQKK